ncbi:hypothetical protein GQ53DRAFT_717249 [Thozetella sp. PMI_491]|nr:hypothetical protein GQ53DRAFT_717249 [Thozetella sp. PMI_491]
MSENTLDADALNQLDKESRELLDAIDNLRYLGVDSFVELPQIVVVGDQSSGKSSVLDAISRVQFPAKSGTCTRFATELVLRSSSEPKVEVTIIHPNQARDSTPAEVLESFNKATISRDEFAKIIEEAKRHMGLDKKNSKGFSQSVLRVQIQGPKLPQLTLVDLPGFYTVETEEQSIEGREIVEALADKYMSQKGSIMLAVISAKCEISNQDVLNKAKKYDDLGERTLGIVTKPDTLELNSSDESKFLQLAKNEEPTHKFKLGWHSLRNRTEGEANSSDDERDKTENEFFERGVWSRLPVANKGVTELRSKLSRILFNHIRQHLPHVIEGIESNIKHRRRKLAELGNARTEPGQHRAYLSNIAKRFESLSRDAIRGLYTDDSFFGALDTDRSRLHNPKKLRACIRQLNRAFEVVMYQNGANRIIRMPDGSFPPKPSAQVTPYLQHIIDLYQLDPPSEVSWAEFNRELEQDAISDEGTEFPGSKNPWLAFRKFKEQSRPWHDLAARHIELVMDVVKSFVDNLLDHTVPDSHIQERILIDCVDPFFSKKMELLSSKLEELLEHYRGDYASQVDSVFLRQLSDRVAIRGNVQGTRSSQVTAFDTEGVIDSMQTYYDMCLRTFTENVMILAAENCLIRHIPNIFEPTMVSEMSDTAVCALGSETREVCEQRNMLEGDLKVLGEGLQECKKFKPRMHNAVTTSSTHARQASQTAPSIFVDESPSQQVPSPRTPPSGYSNGGTPSSSTLSRLKMKKSRRSNGGSRDLSPAMSPPSPFGSDTSNAHSSEPITPPSVRGRRNDFSIQASNQFNSFNKIRPLSEQDRDIVKNEEEEEIL